MKHVRNGKGDLTSDRLPKRALLMHVWRRWWRDKSMKDAIHPMWNLDVECIGLQTTFFWTGKEVLVHTFLIFLIPIQSKHVILNCLSIVQSAPFFYISWEMCFLLIVVYIIIHFTLLWSIDFVFVLLTVHVWRI